ncbi:MAG TPA: N-acetyltransferase [bacterium]|nr:N-acetyltransferase [bacterium]
MDTLTLRRAKPSDARAILNLINQNSSKGLMLPRTFAQVVEKIRDFLVATEGDTLVGVVALHVVGEDLAEVRSLAVEAPYQGQGIGQKLVRQCLKDGEELGLARVFTLTYQTEFFGKLGFQKVEKLTLPQKIWGDCIHCAKFTDCDEVAMTIDLPKAS